MGETESICFNKKQPQKTLTGDAGKGQRNRCNNSLEYTTLLFVWELVVALFSHQYVCVKNQSKDSYRPEATGLLREKKTDNKRSLTERLNVILALKQGRMEQRVQFSLVKRKKKKKDILKQSLLAKARSVFNITYNVSSWGPCKSVLCLTEAARWVSRNLWG